MLNTRVSIPITLLLLVCAIACQAATPTDSGAKQPPKLDNVPAGMEVALFAGGCFWCMEAPFDKLPGVISTTSGYTDGFIENPAYRKVANGETGHTEAVQIIFDPKKVTYEVLLYTFWRNIDPTAKDRQFCDAGTQYRSGIYGYNEAQLATARASLNTIKSGGVISGTIHTEIKAATRFYRAEAYHQDFYKKNPARYNSYRTGCGRDQRLQALWGDKAGH